MKKLFTFLSFIFITFSLFSQKLKIDDLLLIKPTYVHKFKEDISIYQTLKLKMDFNSPEITNQRDISILKDAGILKVELYYTAFQISETFSQPKLNRERIQNLKKIFPDLFNQSFVVWEFKAQNDCKTEEEAREYFHGFIITYKPKPSKEDTRKEIVGISKMMKSDSLGYDSVYTVYKKRVRKKNVKTGYYLPVSKRKAEKGITYEKKGVFKRRVQFAIKVDTVRVGKNDKVRDSAAIVIENKTGKVIAYVGAVASSPSPHVDGIRAYRQAGSALKPFLYSKALETKTLTAASILLDEPTVLSWSGQVYRPLNYDKHFNGPVSVREALASSLNVPAVKIVTIIGLHQTYRVLQDIGLTNLKEPDFYGVSMALGAVEVRLEDLTNAYRIFANGGLLSPLNFVDNTVDKPSSLLEQKRVRIFSPGASYIIGSILSDQNARSTGFGWESPLETPFWTAVKTGTSKDYRDNWCVGFSELYTVGVWTGNFDATPMEKVSGVTGAGPAWYDIMNELHRNKKSAAPNPPEEIVVRKIQHSWASQSTNEFFINGTEPNEEKVVLAEDKQIQFVFPAEGSVLTKDPHLDPSLIALSMRFKGMVPAHAKIYWDGKLLGEAISPFVVEHPPTGSHSVEIRGDDQRVLAKVHFEVRGAKEF